VDVAAPGVHVLSAAVGGGYRISSGTSMAAPHVAGAVALYIARHRDQIPTGADRPPFIMDLVKSTGWQLGDYGYFTGDPDEFPEPLLNVRALLGLATRDLAISITGPQDSEAFELEDPVTLSAYAEQAGADASSAIAWTSNRDGVLGHGGTITGELTEGAHTITAWITDPISAFSASDAITISVGDPNAEPPPPAEPPALLVQTTYWRQTY
jgi:hypothetical protein